MAIVVDHKQVKTVDVVVDGKHYGIPLLTQMPVKDVNKMREAAKKGEDAEFEWGMSYIKRYIPAKVFDTLWMQDIASIFDAIKLETVKDGEQSLGE